MNNKKMRKADKALAEALDFCKSVATNVKNATKAVVLPTIEKPKAVVTPTVFKPKGEVYDNLTIVKMGKGDFRVEVDGKVIDKRFKSVTQANEWCASHQR